MAQPKAKARQTPAGASRLAAKTHKGKRSDMKGSLKPASDADTKAIQQLLARQKQKRKEPPEAAAEPDTKRPKKREGREKTQEAIRLWEELRQHETPAARRLELVSSILALIKGHMVNVAASPTASRIIQSCVKHGSPAHRAQVLDEIRPQLVELAQNPYAHFLVSKLLAKATRADAVGIIKGFKGRVPQLLRHPNGASVIDDAYNAAYPAQRNAMAAEFYGKEFTLFEGSIPASLREVLAAADPVKKRQVLQSLTQHLIPIMEKGLVDPLLSHRLIAEYLEAAPTSAVEDAVQTLSGVNLLRMAHTRDGATAACAVLAYGTAKDRKQAVKAMQGHVKTMASDQWAHLVLLSALSRVDDTALLRKHIISELQAELAELLDNTSARRVLLQLLNPSAASRLLSPEAAAALDPPQRLKAAAPAKASADATEPAQPDAAAAAMADGAKADSSAPSSQADAVQQVPLGLSKKDPVVRRRELLGSGKGSLAAGLLSAASDAAAALLHGKNSGELVTELVRGGSDGLLQEAEPDALASLHDAVVDLAAQPLEAAGDDHVLTEFYSSRTLRHLVLSSADGSAVPFIEKLWARVFNDHCKQYLGSHAEKVLSALLECGSESVKEAARQQLQGVLDMSVDEWLAQHMKAPEGQAPKNKKSKAAK